MCAGIYENFFPYRNRKMVDEHIDNIMQLDNLTPEPGQVQWINFGPDIDLNNFKKIHSGGSNDSYILRSMIHPNVCMRVKREYFVRSLLQKRAEELLIDSRHWWPGWNQSSRRG